MMDLVGGQTTARERRRDRTMTLLEAMTADLTLTDGQRQILSDAIGDGARFINEPIGRGALSVKSLRDNLGDCTVDELRRMVHDGDVIFVNNTDRGTNNIHRVIYRHGKYYSRVW